MVYAFVRSISVIEGNVATVNGVPYTIGPNEFSVGELVVEVPERNEILPLHVLGEGYFLLDEDEDVSGYVK